MSNLAIVLLSVAALVVTTCLAMVSGKRYRQREAEAHATTYAGVIREAHGPLTALLYVSYAVIALWSIAYLVAHWHEFAALWS
jgi:amino acid transporter